MTCIVAVEHDGTVYMGSDRALSTWSITTTMDMSKTVENGPLLIGYCGSLRMGQLLQYALDPPVHHLTWDVDRWVALDLMAAVRSAFEDNVWHKVSEGHAEGGSFLVAVAGRCYEVQSDYSFSRTPTGEYATGSGYQYAFGSLHSTRGEEPAVRVMRALEAAAEHCPSVAGPFDIVTQEAS